MSEQTAEKRVTLVNPQGLHMRPADMFVRTANRFSAEVQVAKGDQFVDGKSILSILTLAAECGSELTIVATGADASEAADALAALIDTDVPRAVEDATQLAGEH